MRLSAARLLTELEALGLTLEVSGDALLVRPAGKLTEGLRRLIDDNRERLLQELRFPAPEEPCRCGCRSFFRAEQGVWRCLQCHELPSRIPADFWFADAAAGRLNGRAGD